MKYSPIMSKQKETHMRNNKNTMNIFGVTDIRDIGKTTLFNDILNFNYWNHRDTVYWLDDGYIVIANMREKQMRTYLVNNRDYVCIRSTTLDTP